MVLLVDKLLFTWLWQFNFLILIKILNQALDMIISFLLSRNMIAVLILQEFYADFVAIDPFHFTLNMPSNHIYMLPAVVDPSGLQHYCDRVVDGIGAIFLALKRRPVIRYQRTSDIAKRIAQETAVSRILNFKTCRDIACRLIISCPYH